MRHTPELVAMVPPTTGNQSGDNFITGRRLATDADHQSGAYISGLSLDEVAAALAVAAGQWGSMAEYLFKTVDKLEELGLHDRRLWQLQELVAERIEATIRQ